MKGSVDASEGAGCVLVSVLAYGMARAGIAVTGAGSL